MKYAGMFNLLCLIPALINMYRNLVHAICVVLLLVSVKRYIFSYIYKILMIYCMLMSFIIQ